MLCEDVTDRLAYLNYVQGALSYTLATEIDKCVPTLDIIFEPVYNVGTDYLPRSRAAWKHVRDAEATLAPRRNIRQNLKNETAKFQTSGGRTGNVDAKLRQLEAQLKKAEADDAPLEKELDLLRRAAIKESEAIKWKAFRDVSEECSDRLANN
jgi:Eisosome component PIL1